MRSEIVLLIVAAVATTPAWSASGAVKTGDAVEVRINWNHVVRVSETIPTTQHLANAMTVRSNPLNKPLLKALRDLHTDDTRLQLWYSVPLQAVAELKEPTATKTFWDFRAMDPVVIDFFAHTKGARHINMGTIPRWMFNVPPVALPSDPAATLYAYTDGTKGELLKDSTGRQFAEFQVRLFQWYTQGGFTDEIGHYHRSGYHFKIDYWGVLNEPSAENKISVEEYTRIFDAVTKAIHAIDPNVQFIGPETVGPRYVLSFARYFLNPKNHDPDAPPVQWFSLHNYVLADNNPASWQDSYFSGPMNHFGASSGAYAEQLRELIQVRDELSPKTKIAIDELGTFDRIKPGDDIAKTEEPYSAYSPLYWVASGANWAANFITAEKLGIPLISMTQMVGAPTQSESCSMINWDTARPNAHYWTLSLIHSHFGPGNKLIETESSSADILAQASSTSSGQEVLLVNASNRTVSVSLKETGTRVHLRLDVVDEASGEQPPRREHPADNHITLSPFAVAVVTMDGK
ncbi:MAG: hypothetical protein P4L10_12250 [Acidobacteriaceae bacterium]|nr:hypothetical protein [Acidobacteriaceae bacterium]